MNKISDEPTPTASNSYLWIACCEGPSAVPEPQSAFSNVFVHQNLGNLVNDTDLNCISVVQTAIELSGVTEAIICGHQGCRAVQAALSEDSLGRIDNWVSPIIQLYEEQRLDLDSIVSVNTLRNRLCELNVYQQVCNLCRTRVVQAVWARGQSFAAHGWIYSEQGCFQDLSISVSNAKELNAAEACISVTEMATQEAVIEAWMGQPRGKYFH